MLPILNTTPKSIEEVEALIIQKDIKLEQQAARIEHQATQIEQLQTQVNWFIEQFRLFRERQYGKSSEKAIPSQQLNLFNEAEYSLDNEPGDAAEKETITYERAKKKPGRKEHPFPELPVEIVEHHLPEEELACECGGQKCVIGKKERDELIMSPAKGKIRRHVYDVYGCRNCERKGTEVPIIVAPGPNALIPKSFASPSSIAYVMTMKYVDGLPLYRQEKHLERMGIKLGRSVLSNWMLKGADYLVLLYGVMRDVLREREILAADETTVQVLKEPNRPAEAKSYMWLYRTGGGSDPPIVLFDYQITRSSDHPKEFLKGFHGYLHVDGYVGYESLPGVKLVGCWSHARRKFDEAIKALPAGTRKKPSKAREGLDTINKLFVIEQKLKNCTPEERLEQRNQLSRPVVESFKIWLDSMAGAVLPKSAIGTAITYCRNQWEKLIRFLEDGRLEIDNNRSERSIKPFVMGRKAWLFANTPSGARASAIIYSIVETAKENKLNPYEYLNYLFEQFQAIDAKDPEAIEKLLPWNVEIPEKS